MVLTVISVWKLDFIDWLTLGDGGGGKSLGSSSRGWGDDLDLRLLVGLHLALLRLHRHCVGAATAVDGALLLAACAGAADAGDDAADDGEHDDAPDCDCPSGSIP